MRVPLMCESGPHRRSTFEHRWFRKGFPRGEAISGRPVETLASRAPPWQSPPLKPMTTSENRFEDLGLIEPLTRAVYAEGYERPTPIQVQAIPYVLDGRDLLGLAQTGTGKTAAFALPILQRLHAKGYRPQGRRPIRVLILTPTRELASQIGESFATYGKNLGFRHAVIFGGVGHEPQRQALRNGLDILVATPGRLLDLAGERIVDFSQLDIFVLDEADRMLDMGFIHDVKRIIALLPKVRQTLFFSATMPPEAQRLADVLLTRPAQVAVTPPSTTVERIDQSIHFVDKAAKRTLLEDILFDNDDIRRVLVFTRTKHGANRVAEHLTKAGERAEAIHGNKSQNARERALAHFKAGQIRVLVATDIAARGIDIDEISHVINFDLPEVPETYVHRIGRTGRAGATGIAISFCDSEEFELLVQIERTIGKKVPLADGTDVPAWASSPRSGTRAPAPRSQPNPRGRRDRPAGHGDHHPPRPPRPPQEQRSAAPRPPAPRGDERGRPHVAPDRGPAPRPAAAPRPAGAAPRPAGEGGGGGGRRRRRRRAGGAPS
jgi:ATP-dependent RNA helicase RhlE